MAEVVTTTASRADITRLIRSLPAMLAGQSDDPHGIASGFRARLAFSFLSLVKRNFDKLSKGGVGADGKRWPPNTREYLAYQKGRFGPTGRYDKKGKPRHRVNRRKQLTPKQFRQWNKDYKTSLKELSLRQPPAKARELSVNVAWAKSRATGAKSLLSAYGSQEDTILVDAGDLRNSLQVGELSESGTGAEYQPGDSEQVFRQGPGIVLVGSKNKTAAYHHNSKKLAHGDGKKGTVQRRLWPEVFPDSWWGKIMDMAVSGLAQIGDLVGSGRI